MLRPRISCSRWWLCIKMICFSLKRIEFVFKMMDFVLTMMELVLKMMNFVFKMMDRRRRRPRKLSTRSWGDEYSINNDEFLINNDELCIQNDGVWSRKAERRVRIVEEKRLQEVRFNGRILIFLLETPDYHIVILFYSHAVRRLLTHYIYIYYYISILYHHSFVGFLYYVSGPFLAFCCTASPNIYNNNKLE